MNCSLEDSWLHLEKCSPKMGPSLLVALLERPLVFTFYYFIYFVYLGIRWIKVT